MTKSGRLAVRQPWSTAAQTPRRRIPQQRSPAAASTAQPAGADDRAAPGHAAGAAGRSAEAAEPVSGHAARTDRADLQPESAAAGRPTPRPEVRGAGSRLGRDEPATKGHPVDRGADPRLNAGHDLELR